MKRLIEFKLFESENSLKLLLDYVKKFNYNEVKLPFSENKYYSFANNMNPEIYDKEGYLKDSQYEDGFLYSDGKYCREVISPYGYLKILKYLFDYNNTFKLYDLGCGIGNVLYFAKKIGFQNPIGIESQKEFKKIHDKLNLDIIYGNLLQMNLNFLQNADIVYLYKPIYDDSLAKKLIDKLLENTKSEVIIIYCDPDDYFFDRKNIISPSTMNQYILHK